MKRRNFIKNTLLATGAATLHPLDTYASSLLPKEKEAFATSSEKTLPFKKSIMWDTIGVPGTILEKCQLVKRAGFDGVEPSSHMDRKEMKEALEATGLKASSVCNAKHWALPSPIPTAE